MIVLIIKIVTTVLNKTNGTQNPNGPIIGYCFSVLKKLFGLSPKNGSFFIIYVFLMWGPWIWKANRSNSGPNCQACICGSQRPHTRVMFYVEFLSKMAEFLTPFV